MSVLARWKARRAIRLALLKAARARLKAHNTPSNVAVVNARKAQVAQADRVIARHAATNVTGVSQAGVKLIADFEGCELRPYQDSVGVWTIGYGHTENVNANTRPLVNQAAAAALLQRDLDKKYAPPVARLNLPLTQQQFDAVTSAVYNLGPGILDRGRSLGDALRAHNWPAAADAFLLYDKAGGKTLAGLTRRRRAERTLFLKGTR